jgi:hypothetical protein
MKRSLLIIIAIIAVIVIVGVIYWFFLRNLLAAPGQEGSTGSLPQTGTGIVGGGGNSGSGGALPSGGNPAGGIPTATTRFGVVSNEPIFAYFVDAQNNVIAVEPDGKIAYITNGQTTFLSSSQIENLLSADFSYDGTKILVNFGDPNSPQTSIFNLATKSWSPLAAGIISPIWSPSDYRIAYLTANAAGVKSLATFDVSKNTAKPTTLLSLNAQDLSLSWPQKNTITLSDKPSAFAQGFIWLFDIQKKTLARPIADNFGLETLWSNTTSSVGIIFSSGAGKFGGTLSIMNDVSTNQTKNIVFLTLPSKCAFHYEAAVTSSVSMATTATSASTTASTTTLSIIPPYLALYCAVPNDPATLTRARLPDDYNQETLFTVDNFYKVHTNTGDMESFFLPTVPLDATNLKMFNNILFFVNRYDQKLYAISAE